MHPFFRVIASPEQTATMAALGKKCASLYADIEASVPNSHYKTEALMYLEKAAMLASKGITHGTPKKEGFT